jgi:hypothetical protein
VPDSVIERYPVNDIEDDPEDPEKAAPETTIPV